MKIKVNPIYILITKNYLEQFLNEYEIQALKIISTRDDTIEGAYLLLKHYISVIYPSDLYYTYNGYNQRIDNLIQYFSERIKDFSLSNISILDADLDIMRKRQFGVEIFTPDKISVLNDIYYNDIITEKFEGIVELSCSIGKSSDDIRDYITSIDKIEILEELKPHVRIALLLVNLIFTKIDEVSSRDYFVDSYVMYTKLNADSIEIYIV